MNPTYRTSTPPARYVARITRRERMWRRINLVTFTGIALFISGMLMLDWTPSKLAVAMILAGWAMGGLGSAVGLYTIGEERHAAFIAKGQKP